VTYNHHFNFFRDRQAFMKRKRSTLTPEQEAQAKRLAVMRDKVKALMTHNAKVAGCLIWAGRRWCRLSGVSMKYRRPLTRGMRASWARKGDPRWMLNGSGVVGGRVAALIHDSVQAARP
jgi:hypothetical protein